jgi:hypothetical protein
MAGKCVDEMSIQFSIYLKIENWIVLPKYQFLLFIILNLGRVFNIIF